MWKNKMDYNRKQQCFWHIILWKFVEVVCVCVCGVHSNSNGSSKSICDIKLYFLLCIFIINRIGKHCSNQFFNTKTSNLLFCFKDVITLLNCTLDHIAIPIKKSLLVSVQSFHNLSLSLFSEFSFYKPTVCLRSEWLQSTPCSLCLLCLCPFIYDGVSAWNNLPLQDTLASNPKVLFVLKTQRFISIAMFYMISLAELIASTALF